ncbi:hypothetical protein HA397_30330, partial [Escherichia coli]|nr:hypothetical protein [Escherichia coli]
VSAEQTTDPNGRPLSFTWAVLSGDPARVRVIPLDPSGTRARIEIDWHDKRPQNVGSQRLTSRVDIGVFAWNGVHDSAPGLISIAFPTHQLRSYAPAPQGGAPQLDAIGYDADAAKVYYDPLLFWSAPWADKLIYDENGNLTGRNRTMGEKTVSLDAQGDLTEGGTPRS